MTEIEITTGGSDSDSGNVEQEESRTGKMKKEAQEKFQEMKESASEKKDRLARKWSETAEETRRAAREAGYKAKDAGTAVYDAISENLFPVILTGIGAAWLTASILRSRSDSDLAADSSETSLQSKSRLQDRAKEVGEKAREVSERAWEKTLHTKEKSWEIMTKNTFYVAGAFAAMGLLVGLAFPETQGEQRVIDELRDEYKGKTETTDAGGDRVGVQETF